MRRFICVFGALVLISACGAERRFAGRKGWADVHVHVFGRPDTIPGSVQDLVRVMDEDGIRVAVVMPPPQNVPRFPYSVFLGAIQKYPDRFRFLGGGGSLNPLIQHAAGLGFVPAQMRDRFERQAQQILSDGAIGFGEMTALHFAYQPGQPYQRVPADHPLFLLLADIAAEHDVVIDFHMELVARRIETLPGKLASQANNPKSVEPNLAEFERLLAHNHGAKIVWAHVGTDYIGQRTPAITAELLARHSNLYLSILPFPESREGFHETFIVDGHVNREWLHVMEAYPERFVIGCDQFFVGGVGTRNPSAIFAKTSPERRAEALALLTDLPDTLARQIGFENAARLYKLPSQ